MKRKTGRPVGYRESEETREKKSRSMKDRLLMKKQPKLPWKEREGWRPFGDRLDFLSPESSHLESGKLAILPAKERELRDKEA